VIEVFGFVTGVVNFWLPARQKFLELAGRHCEQSRVPDSVCDFGSLRRLGAVVRLHRAGHLRMAALDAQNR
jgi:hypothetical protein